MEGRFGVEDVVTGGEGWEVRRWWARQAPVMPEPMIAMSTCAGREGVLRWCERGDRGVCE